MLVWFTQLDWPAQLDWSTQLDWFTRGPESHALVHQCVVWAAQNPQLRGEEDGQKYRTVTLGFHNTLLERVLSS